MHDHENDSDGEDQNKDSYRNGNTGCVDGVRALFFGGAAEQAILILDRAVSELTQVARELNLLAIRSSRPNFDGGAICLHRSRLELCETAVYGF